MHYTKELHLMMDSHPATPPLPQAPRDSDLARQAHAYALHAHECVVTGQGIGYSDQGGDHFHLAHYTRSITADTPHSSPSPHALTHNFPPHPEVNAYAQRPAQNP